MSGFSTTGATVLTDVEGLSRSMAMWRQFTAWLGGLGIIVLFLAVLPRLNVAGRQALFRTEAAGPELGLEATIRETARRFVALYIAITALEIVVLAGLGWTGVDERMTFYQAVAHAFATIATAGFSTDARSIEPFAAETQWAIVVFMILAGTNFALLFTGIIKRRFGALRRDEEFRVYLVLLAVASLIVAFAEIQLGADLYCLHKNRWWQTSRGPLLDARAFVAGLEYATGVDAVVLGKPSPAYFAAALDALGAEPELTWLVATTSRRTCVGPRCSECGRRSFAPASSDPTRSSSWTSSPTSSSARSPTSPSGSNVLSRLRGMAVRVGTDVIEIERIRRALERPGFRDRCFTPAEQDYCESRRNPAESLRGALLRQGGRRQGARLRRALHLEGDRDRRPAEARGHARAARPCASPSASECARSTSR